MNRAISREEDGDFDIPLPKSLQGDSSLLEELESMPESPDATEATAQEALDKLDG